MSAWVAVIEDGVTFLSKTAKDLRAAYFVCQAMVQARGIAGLQDALLTIDVLVTQFWKDLHPELTTSRPADRIMPLRRLFGLEEDGQLPLAVLPMTALTAGTVPWSEFQKAQQGTENERQEKIVNAARESGSQHFQHSLEAVEECRKLLTQIDTKVEAGFGSVFNTPGYAPPKTGVKDFRKKLVIYGHDLRELAITAFPELDIKEIEAESESSSSDQNAKSGSTTSNQQISSRREALAALHQIARYFRDAEPHSPISYAVEQAVRWSEMSLPQLLTELITDTNSRSQLFKRVGITDPES